MMLVNDSLVSCEAAATQEGSYYAVTPPSWWGPVFDIDDSQPVKYNSTHYLVDSEGNYVQYSELPELRNYALTSQTTATEVAAQFTAFFSGKSFTLTTLTPAEAEAAAVLSMPQELSCTIDGNVVNCSVIVEPSGSGYYCVRFQPGFSISSGYSVYYEPGEWFLTYNGKYLVDQGGEYVSVTQTNPHEDFLPASSVARCLESAEAVFELIDGKSYTTSTELVLMRTLTVRLTNPVNGENFRDGYIRIERKNSGVTMETINVPIDSASGTWTASVDFAHTTAIEVEIGIYSRTNVSGHGTYTNTGGSRIQSRSPYVSGPHVCGAGALSGNGTVTIDEIIYNP